MKKLLDRRQSILKKLYRRDRRDFWTDEGESYIRIIHKYTGFIFTKPKFNTTNKLPRRKNFKYFVSYEDF